MLHVLTAAEELPIRILHPTRHDRFIAFVESVLEVHHADHQPRVHPRPTELVGVALVDGRVELLPIDLFGQDVERVLGIQQFAQMGAKQLALRSGSFRFHCLPAFSTKRSKTWQILAPF